MRVLFLSSQQNTVVSNLLLLPGGQPIVGLAGCIDFCLAVQGNRTDGFDEIFHILNRGVIAARILTVFQGPVIGIVQYDRISVFQLLLCNTLLGMIAVNGIHPAGIGAIIKLAQSIYRRDVITAGVHIAVFALQRQVDQIYNRCRRIQLIVLLSQPGSQIAVI